MQPVDERDPVVDYDDGLIREALDRLRRKAREYIARAQDYEAEAQKLFKRAGVKTNP